MKFDAVLRAHGAPGPAQDARGLGGEVASRRSVLRRSGHRRLGCRRPRAPRAAQTPRRTPGRAWPPARRSAGCAADRQRLLGARDPCHGSARPDKRPSSARPRRPRRGRSPEPDAASRPQIGRGDADRTARARRGRPRTARSPRPPPSRARESGSRSGSAAAEPPGRSCSSLPRVGFISPAAWRSRVDLPAPLRPISATRSPESIRKLTLRRITGPLGSSCQTRSKDSAGATRACRAARGSPLGSVGVRLGERAPARAIRPAPL